MYCEELECEAMIEKDTVLVLGAGASIPYGFPSGLELKRMIVDEVRRPIGGLADSKRFWPFKSWEERKQFADDLAESGSTSIDRFLEHRDDRYLEIGKVLIARALIQKERTSRLYWRTSSPSHLPLERDWYCYLLSNLLSGWSSTPKPDTAEPSQPNSLTVVTLNYDRSLEHYLHNSLQRGLGWSLAEVTKWLEGVTFIHPYGTLGKLPWQGFSHAETREYENTRDPGIERKAANQLRILSKEREVSELGFEEAYAVLKKAHRVIVLGFGFDFDNVERLKLRDIRPPEAVASAFGMTHNVRGQAQFLLGDHPWKIGQEDEDCLKLLQRTYGTHVEFLKGFAPKGEDGKVLFPVIPKGIGKVRSVPKVKTKFDQ
jgi:hypothetical protein